MADSIRLGGAILKHYPEMLSAQLLGRLLPERQGSRNIKSLLQQCDTEGVHHNALVPSFHCMHTPGGPLKYSMEGHQFAIFAMKLTSDHRYIVSVSNKFITFDVVTSDLARQVYPGVEGLMVDLELSADNKFAAAYTSNNQTVLLNTLVGEFIIIDNPFMKGETVLERVGGLLMLEGKLVIVGQRSWAVYDMAGNKLGHETSPMRNEILFLRTINLTDFVLTTWNGSVENPQLELIKCQDGSYGNVIKCHSAITIKRDQTKAFLCDQEGSYEVSVYKVEGATWTKDVSFGANNEVIVMLALSTNETWCIATTKIGFKLWHVETLACKTLLLPHSVRNVLKKFGQSSSLVLSAGDR